MTIELLASPGQPVRPQAPNRPGRRPQISPRSSPVAPKPLGREAGSGSALMAAAVLIAGIVIALGLAVGAAITQWQRIRAAADLVALSAAVAFADGNDACRAAARLAGANRVELRSCVVTGDLLDYAVTVKVGPAPGTPLLPAGLTTTAHAGARIKGG